MVTATRTTSRGGVGTQRALNPGRADRERFMQGAGGSVRAGGGAGRQGRRAVTERRGQIVREGSAIPSGCCSSGGPWGQGRETAMSGAIGAPPLVFIVTCCVNCRLFNRRVAEWLRPPRLLASVALREESEKCLSLTWASAPARQRPSSGKQGQGNGTSVKAPRYGRA